MFRTALNASFGTVGLALANDERLLVLRVVRAFGESGLSCNPPPTPSQNLSNGFFEFCFQFGFVGHARLRLRSSINGTAQK